MSKIEFRFTRKGIEMNGEGVVATMGILLVVAGIATMALLVASGSLAIFHGSRATSRMDVLESNFANAASTRKGNTLGSPN